MKIELLEVLRCPKTGQRLILKEPKEPAGGDRDGLGGI